MAGCVDVDPKKWTRAIGGTGAPVIGPEELPLPGKIMVPGHVSAHGARELIRGGLTRRGYVEGWDFLICA